MATLDFFYDLASTYSYLAAVRIGPLAQAAGVTVRWRPFLLGPIFKAQGYNTSPFNVHQLKGRNMVRDCERQCAELGLPFRLPSPFPAISLLAGRVAHVGLAEGWGEDFSRAVYSAEFGGGCACPRAIRRDQECAARRDRGRRETRYFRRTELRRRGRAVLG
jgi:2-hydroxychromene-2-carboxylate isomerase